MSISLLSIFFKKTLPLGLEMKGLPKVSPELSAARRSKHRAGAVDDEVGVMAERRKALRNEGNSEGSDPLI
jgi:hypothetical protein